jgi:hypothetical protein
MEAYTGRSNYRPCEAVQTKTNPADVIYEEEASLTLPKHEENSRKE